MKTFLIDLLSKLNIYSSKEKPLDRLLNSHWVSLGDITNLKRVFIFRSSNELLVSENGRVKKCTWDYLSDKALLIEILDESYLLKIDFIDDCIIALKIDGQVGHAFFINETVYGKEINNSSDVVHYLKTRYLPKLLAQEKGPKLDSLKFHMNNIKNSFLFDDDSDYISIVQLIRDEAISKESAYVFMDLYNQRFGSDLIDDLYNLSTSKNIIKYLLAHFIELNMVQAEYPHKRLH